MSDARQSHRPCSHTVREYPIQLVTILVALAVDGVVESKREQALVERPRGAIARGIASNLKDLQGKRQLVDSVFGLSSVGMGGDPTKASPDKLRLFRRRALESQGAVMVHAGLVRGLVEAYRGAPRATPGP